MRSERGACGPASHTLVWPHTFAFNPTVYVQTTIGATTSRAESRWGGVQRSSTSGIDGNTQESGKSGVQSARHFFILAWLFGMA